MPTKELLAKSRTLKRVIEKAEREFLFEIAAINFNHLLKQSQQHLGDKLAHIDEVETPNVSALDSEKIDKGEMLTKIDELIATLETVSK